MYELLPDGTKVDIPVDDGKALSCLCKILLSKDSYLSVNDVASALGISPQSYGVILLNGSRLAMPL